jgi:hypothetical protein
MLAAAVREREREDVELSNLTKHKGGTGEMVSKGVKLEALMSGNDNEYICIYIYVYAYNMLR